MIYPSKYHNLIIAAMPTVQALPPMLSRRVGAAARSSRVDWNGGAGRPALDEGLVIRSKNLDQFKNMFKNMFKNCLHVYPEYLLYSYCIVISYCICPLLSRGAKAAAVAGCFYVCGGWDGRQSGHLRG